MKLVRGAGSPEEGACWMSAVQYYVDGKLWHDHPECVDPVIRKLCIWVNDTLRDGEREEKIGPYIFLPVGTNMGSALSVKRALRAADWAVREIAPIALQASGFGTIAPTLRLLQPVRDRASADAAAHAAAHAADAVEYAAADAAYAAYAAAYAAYAASAAAYAADAAYAAYAASAAAYAAEYAVLLPGLRGGVVDSAIALIVELCGMGSEEPVNTCTTKEKTLEMLNR
jgi:hypothetical protein